MIPKDGIAAIPTDIIINMVGASNNFHRKLQFTSKFDEKNCLYLLNLAITPYKINVINILTDRT